MPMYTAEHRKVRYNSRVFREGSSSASALFCRFDHRPAQPGPDPPCQPEEILPLVRTIREVCPCRPCRLFGITRLTCGNDVPFGLVPTTHSGLDVIERQFFRRERVTTVDTPVVVPTKHPFAQSFWRPTTRSHVFLTRVARHIQPRSAIR